MACFEVPPEWGEAIRSICLDAENGILPHPSTDAQRLYGRNDVRTQVCPLLIVTIIAISLVVLVPQAAYYN